MAVKDTATGATLKVGSFSPPSSYTTGGILVDLSARFAWLGFLDVAIESAGSLPPVHFEWTLNRDLSGASAPGKAVLKIMRDRYDRATVGNVSGQPGGVTVQAAKAATGTTTGSSHTHGINHVHPNVTSSTLVTGAGGGPATAVGGVAWTNHTHDVNLPNFTGTSGAQTHAHDRSFEYEHNHPTTQAESNAASVEIPAATNLSATVLRYRAAGF